MRKASAVGKSASLISRRLRNLTVSLKSLPVCGKGGVHQPGGNTRVALKGLFGCDRKRLIAPSRHVPILAKEAVLGGEFPECDWSCTTVARYGYSGGKGVSQK